MTQPLDVASAVRDAFDQHPIVDIHTHLFPPEMGPMFLWGPDDLLTYHYLKAETSRQLPSNITVEAFNTMPKEQQADIIWKTLFVGNSSPISEAQVGIVTVMTSLGLDPRADDLSQFRRYCKDVPVADYVDGAFEKAGISRVYMTNDPLDPAEGPLWQNGFDRDPRFKAVLRLDSALMNWPDGIAPLKALGFDVSSDLGENTFSELRRYLNTWCDLMDARYMAISLPPDFTYPGDAPITRLMREVVYPTARDRGIPSAMMVGVRRQVNPVLRDGGDGTGSWDLRNLENVAHEWPDVDFMITLLSRENQHELCVAARKFPNIVPFGCWWFLNNPSIIREITAERIELLGTSFIPQHSDARILDQIMYKWPHSKRVIAPVFAEKYQDLLDTGYPLTENDIKRDIAHMFGGGRLLGN